jgi:DNA-directed RNA polymerase sigma subunit (sigma70/sigma32)
MSSVKRHVTLKHGDYEVTLGECARRLGMTRNEVDNIERSALRKIREFCVAHGFNAENLLGEIRGTK